MPIEYRARFLDGDSEPIDIWIERGDVPPADTLQFQSADNQRVKMSLDQETARDLAELLHRFADSGEIAR